MSRYRYNEDRNRYEVQHYCERTKEYSWWEIDSVETLLNEQDAKIDELNETLETTRDHISGVNDALKP